MTCFNCLCGV